MEVVLALRCFKAVLLYVVISMSTYTQENQKSVNSLSQECVLMSFLAVSQTVFHTQKQTIQRSKTNMVDEKQMYTIQINKLKDL